MDSVHQTKRPGGAGRFPPGCAAGPSQGLLEGVVRVSGAWLESLAPNDPQRENIVRLGVLAGDLVKAGDYSADAMTTARALLCVNCRRLNAVQGKCRGRSLDRCLLLKERGPRIVQT